MSDSTTIRIGERPAAIGALGTYFDGETADAQPARLRIDESRQALVIELGARNIIWPLADIRQIPDQADKKELLLANASDPVARLRTDEARIALRCPNLKQRNTHVKRGKVLGWAGAALASVAVIIFVLVPLMANQLADFIPPEGEKALGDTTLTQIRTAFDQSSLDPIPFCENPAGTAALKAIETRLAEHAGLGIPPTVSVLDHEMINAFALPGGHIVFFRGLIETANEPEELAAVFAHEMGHVVSRDPTRHALRSAGSIGVLGLLFGDFAGGALMLFLTERLIDAQYSQAAEIAADQFAMDVMERSGIAPRALGDMFTHFTSEHGSSDNVASHFASHPATASRIADSLAFHEDAVARGLAVMPLLSDQEWKALQGICG